MAAPRDRTMRALRAECDALLSQIAELKRQRRQGDPPEAKRRRHLPRRLTFKVAQTGLAPVPQPSELVGRHEAVAEVRSAAARNYMGRGREDPAQHGFLSFNGHVRTGKTRMGEEVPRIIDEMRGAGSGRAWAQAVYLDIRFQGGAQFAADLDRGHAPGCRVCRPQPPHPCLALISPVDLCAAFRLAWGATPGSTSASRRDAPGP